MTNQKQDQEKKDLIVLDFDGTVFLNLRQNFSSNIPIEHLIDAYTFFNEFMFQTNEIVLNSSEFILITGRNQDQRELIIQLLEMKGFRIDQAYFNQIERTTTIDENSFLIKYWTAKAKLINELRLSNEYKSITVIEDSEIICSMLSKLGFTVYKTQITKNNANQSLTVKFNPPQVRFMSELETILKPQKVQKESLLEIT